MNSSSKLWDNYMAKEFGNINDEFLQILAHLALPSNLSSGTLMSDLRVI